MLLKVPQVAERLSCSIATVYELVESGQLPAVKIGAGGGGLRVLTEDLESFIEDRRVHPAPAPQSVKKVVLKHLR